MDSQRPWSFSTFVPASILMAFAGWGGIAALWIFTLPTLWPRWLFFFLGVSAVTGTVLPILAFLNLRFPTDPPAAPGVIVREAVWFGIYFPTLAWLQLGRVLSPLLAVLLFIGLALIEGLLRLRESSFWKPG